MEKEIIGGALGSVGKYDLAFKEGNLVIELDANVVFGSAGLVVKVSAKAVLDAIAKAIPGTIDDSIIKLLEGALGV